MLRGVAQRVGDPLVGREIVGVEDLDRQDAAARRDSDRTTALPGGRDYARAWRAVDVVARHLVERKAEQLRPRIVLARIVVRHEEIAPDPIRRALVGVLPDPRLEVRMVDVDAIVEHRDHDGALAARDLPGARRVDVLALGRAARALVAQVPLRRRNGRQRRLPPVLRNEIRRGEHNFVERRPLVGDFEQFLAGVLAVRVIDDVLVARERVAPPHREPARGKELLARCRGDLGLEPDDDLAVHDAQRAARLVAEGHRRRSLGRRRRRHRAGTPAELEEAARRPRDQRSCSDRVARRVRRDLHAQVVRTRRRREVHRQRRELNLLAGLGQQMHGVTSHRWVGSRHVGLRAGSGARIAPSCDVDSAGAT